MHYEGTRAALLLGLLMVAVVGGAAPAPEGAEIAVAVNGQVHHLTPQPQMIEGRVLVPIRGVLELAEAKVEWNAGDRSITVTRGKHRAVLAMDRSTITADGHPVLLEAPPKLIAGSVYVSLRALAESVGGTARWNETLHMVMLTVPRLPKPIVRLEDPGTPGASPVEPVLPPDEAPARPPEAEPKWVPDDSSRFLMYAALRPAPAAARPEAA